MNMDGLEGMKSQEYNDDRSAIIKRNKASPLAPLLSDWFELLIIINQIKKLISHYKLINSYTYK